MVSPTVPSSSMNSKEHSVVNNEMATNIKIEDGNDEIKVFSASKIETKESDDDEKDSTDIEDRLSPVVDEPTSPTKNDSLNNNITGLYSSPFLYPYFHPYFMTATTQMHSSTDKIPMNAPMNNPFGATSSFPGMPFFPLYPPGMMNQPFQPNFFNPFGFPMPTPGVNPIAPSHRHQQPSNSNESRRCSSTSLEKKRPSKPHIKKPLNAFMIYMKEQRARIIEECTLKESSAINKILGQKWKELSRSEQDRYYELAKEERNRHMQMYPNWSARDNYGIKKKRDTGRVRKSHGEEKSTPQKQFIHNSKQVDNDCLNPKKCRARYGLEGLHLWCKHCRRKKKCTRFLEDDLPNSGTLGNPSSSGNLSSISSPATHQSDDKDSIDDPDSDDILSRQIDSIEDEHDDSNEENKQDFYHLSSNLPSQFAPKFHY